VYITALTRSMYSTSQTRPIDSIVIYIKYYKAVYDMAIYIVLYNGDHKANDKTTHNASTPAR
jgi:hypothetical protein